MPESERGWVPEQARGLGLARVPELVPELVPEWVWARVPEWERVLEWASEPEQASDPGPGPEWMLARASGPVTARGWQPGAVIACRPS